MWRLCDWCSLPQVSLEEKKATVSFDQQVINPEQIRGHIDDMGFEATLLETQTSDSTQTCTISIQGMTCNSCVRNIEGNIGGKTGVKNIKVIFLSVVFVCTIFFSFLTTIYLALSYFSSRADLPWHENAQLSVTQFHRIYVLFCWITTFQAFLLCCEWYRWT